MKPRSLVPPSFVLFCLLAAGTACASSPEVATKPDSRLQQKATYDRGYGRLHTVVEGLSQATDVKLLCGRAGDDWRVRDVPVIVFAEGVPLGRLLKSICAATHTQLTFTTVKTEEPDAPKIYRVCRDRRSEMALQSNLDARENANLALVDWAWDVLSKFGTTPVVNLDTAPGVSRTRRSIDADRIRLVSRFMASLGQDVKDRVFSGEQVIVKMSSAKDPSAYEDLYRYACKQPLMQQDVNIIGANRSGAKLLEPSAQDIRNSEIALKLIVTPHPDPSGGLHLSVGGVPLEQSNAFGPSKDVETWSAYPAEIASVLATAKGLEFPPRPDPDSVMQESNDSPGPGFKALESDDDWKLPALQTKVRIDLSKLKRTPVRADVLEQLAGSTGYSVICEDFRSQMYPYYSSVTADYGSDSTLGTVLRQMDGSWRLIGLKWFINENEKLLVGRERLWRDHHLALVQEATLASIKAKREGDGAELDDIAPLIALSKDQFREWGSQTPDFAGWELTFMDADLPFWRLYAALSAQDKKLARSDNGLTLAKFDPAWLNEFFQATVREQSNNVIYDNASRDRESRSKPESRFAPEVLSTITLRVSSENIDSWDVRALDEQERPKSTTYRTSPNGPRKHAYRIDVDGTRDGAPFHFSAPWYNMAFPIYSAEKEAELRRKTAATTK